jgi:hypothetical protein
VPAPKGDPWARIQEVRAMIEDAIDDTLPDAGTPSLPGGVIAIDREGAGRARDLLRSGGTSADVEANACMRAMLVFTCWKSYQKNVYASVARHWIATHGVLVAIDMLIASRARWWWSHERKLSARILNSEQRAINQDDFMEEEWLVVRSHLASADDATWNAAVARAKAAWPNAGRGLRCMLAYALPGEDDLAKDALATCIGTPHASNAAKLLYTTCRDEEFLKALDAFVPAQADDVYEIAASLGERALPFAVDAFRRAATYRPKARPLKEALAALSIIENEEAAAFVVSQLPNAKLRQLIVAYCKRSANVALPALEAEAKRAGPKSPAAQVFALLEKV